MKKSSITLLLFVLFCATIVNAQRSQEILNSIQDMDSTAVFKFADNIASSAVTEYTYMEAHEDEGDLQVKYSRLDLTPKETKYQSEYGCSSCLIVYFRRNANNTYKFYEVFASREDLLPTWEREFLIGDLKESKFGYRYLEDKSIGLNVRLQNNNGLWYINNSSH